MAKDISVEFWFSIGSTYTYLSVTRLAAVEQERGSGFIWRPFSVRAIMTEQNNSPFRNKPIKAAYMWRDIERRAGLYGIPFRGPAPYPIANLELANQVAIVGTQEGWGAAYAVATYRRWFLDFQEPGSEPNLSASLREIGQDPDRVIPLAQSDAIAAALKVATDRARELNVFGAPTFVVGEEVFWGDDRLDDALTWAEYNTLRPAVTGRGAQV